MDTAGQDLVCHHFPGPRELSGAARSRRTAVQRVRGVSWSSTGARGGAPPAATRTRARSCPPTFVAVSSPGTSTTVSPPSRSSGWSSGAGRRQGGARSRSCAGCCSHAGSTWPAAPRSLLG